jgi:hypothetical protein
MKLSVNLLIAGSLLLCAQARAQPLIYALSYAETPQACMPAFHAALWEHQSTTN